MIAFLMALLLLCSFGLPVLAATGESGSGFTFGTILEFIKGIFIPSKDYFHTQISRLNDKVNEKLGGLGYLYRTIDNFFDGLGSSTANADITFTLPNNYFYRGYQGMSIDFLTSARPYLKVFKDVLTAACCIFTAIVCYHKLRTLFEV